MKRRTGLAAIAAAMLAICAGLALGQMPASGQGGQGTIAAVVNGASISMTQLKAAVQMGGPLPANLPEAQRRLRYMQALGMLIDNMLMSQFLEKHVAPANPVEVQKRLVDLEAGLKEQGKSMAEFLRDSHHTLDQLKAEIAEYLGWMAYTTQKVTDADVERYYRENKDVFDKVSVRASHIMLRLPQNATEADKAKARATLQQIRAKLVSDPRADFAEMAKQHSQDPQAQKGGDLGWFPRKWVFEESFSKAAFALQVGQISDVVESEFGLHLIKVTERKPGEKSDFAKIKPAVRDFYLEDLRQQILAEQRKTARIELIAVK
jgi:parvulin-like peptidyl-prolyl isomerase